MNVGYGTDTQRIRWECLQNERGFMYTCDPRVKQLCNWFTVSCKNAATVVNPQCGNEFRGES